MGCRPYNSELGGFKFQQKLPPALESSNMEFSQSDFDRLLLSEHNRKTAEANYAKDPLDADVSISSFLLNSLFIFLIN